MTDERKQTEREAKRLAIERLTSADLGKYLLRSIDPRLLNYFKSLIADPVAHNVYELLGAVKFLRLLESYSYDTAAAQNFMTFYEFLKFSGQNGRQSYRLTPVQVFQFASIMGFVRDDGHRLVRNALLFVPRKFSKTTSVCAFAIYDFLFGDDNAQAYTGANSYDQAKICFDEISRVLHGLDPGWTRFKATRELIKWRDGRHSSIRCLSNSPDKLDGLNASTVILDEYAQADSADLRNVLTTSMGMRDNPLLVTITTASDKQTAPFVQELEHEQGVLLREVLGGHSEDDTSFSHIFMPDCDDDESDPATWAKVQPHLGITVRPDFYERQWAEAQKSAENMKAFRTKMLNIFVTGNDKSWIDGSTIREHSRKLDIDSLGYRADCEVAVDLSVDNDFSAVSYYIYLKNEQRSHIHTEYYFPNGQMAKHPNKEVYQRWVDGGYLHLCEGNIIDYGQMVNDILAHGRYLRILQIGYDPNKAADFTNLIIAAGGMNYLYPYKQTYYYFTKPCMAILRMIELGLLTFNENPINNYCFDNCILDRDNMDNCKPLKRSENKKIDGAITSLMALGASLEQKRFAGV